MSPLRVAVIGAGFFGSRHVQNYAALEGAELVAVCDADRAMAEAATGRYGGEAIADPETLLGRVDAVSIATPTASHHPLGRMFLDAGIGVLVEKPMTRTLAEADDLIAAAARSGAVLQTGHLERFNGAYAEVCAQARSPRLIVARRIAPFRPRGTDVSVVLDLMIHDIDLVLALAGSAPEEVSAIGGSVFSPTDDFAQATLRFAGGCTASITASRVATVTERVLSVHTDDRVMTADLGTSKLQIAHRDTAGDAAEAEVVTDEHAFTHGNTLARQLESFLAAVRGEAPVVVDGKAGRAALDVALAIIARIAEGNRL
ncbi:MAG: Gfo/Idh/MocA family oxidoreductase [Rhodospirillaceae bacterium]|nr:Gfo/Idh/MocA family oxidoreductase [Rhodospirillaceae bacterium]